MLFLLLLLDDVTATVIGITMIYFRAIFTAIVIFVATVASVININVDGATFTLRRTTVTVATTFISGTL